MLHYWTTHSEKQQRRLAVLLQVKENKRLHADSIKQGSPVRPNVIRDTPMCANTANTNETILHIFTFLSNGKSNSRGSDEQEWNEEQCLLMPVPW
jgi:hypothetical protein